MQTCSVIPLTRLDKELGYRVPEALEGRVEVGCLVRVPIGPRSELGLVARLGDDGSFPAEKMKFLHALEQPFPVLTPGLLRLADWMRRYYAAGLGDILEVMIPAPARKGMRPQERVFIRLERRLPVAELEALRKRAPQQARIHDFLADQLEGLQLARPELLQRLQVPASALAGLVAKGICAEVQGRVEREAYMDGLSQAESVAPKPSFDLNAEQVAAAQGLSAAVTAGGFASFLLHGVTGSGKTEVYLEALKAALAVGGGAIFLVPEVALTPQTVGRLRARLESVSGVRAVVWHSHLSEGERYDAWHALATGAARVVVGARSAIFAPIRDLRLIIVDEEHEPAYKQDETPRYHGRDVAVYRAFVEGVTCVLGSATPSLETLYNVQVGKYRALHLTKRVDDRKLPLIHVVDMRLERGDKNSGFVFSRLLARKLTDRFEKGEQTILFLNRRGYDASLSCPDCGHVATCDHCSISMTHHRADKLLRCHLCGDEEHVPDFCPKCKSPRIHYRGSGTQKIEDFAQRLLPKARVVRIDADTMQKKNLFRTILGEFRAGKIHVLVGTQMIAKGLDFPNVTLVGLVDADISLHMADFRAAERTFQLLVQVAGRAGRGDLAGEVVVQTHLPHAGPINFGRQQDFHGFAESELEARREFNYPPYRHLIHHLFRATNPEKLTFYTEAWVRHLEQVLQPEIPFEIRGPAPCPVEKIKDQYRHQVWYFVDSPTKLVPRLDALRRAFKWDPEIIEVLDVDAVSLM